MCVVVLALKIERDCVFVCSLCLLHSQDMYSVSARKKNEHDPTVYPVLLRRHDTTTLERPGAHQALLDPWQQGQGYRWVGSELVCFAGPLYVCKGEIAAMTLKPLVLQHHPVLIVLHRLFPFHSVLQPDNRFYQRPLTAVPRRPVHGDGRDTYDGWSIRQSHRNIFPSDDFPLYTTYVSRCLLTLCLLTAHCAKQNQLS